MPLQLGVGQILDASVDNLLASIARAEAEKKLADIGDDDNAAKKKSLARKEFDLELSSEDKAILEIEKQAGSLSDIEGLAVGIQDRSEKILKKISTVRKSLGKQLATLQHFFKYTSLIPGL